MRIALTGPRGQLGFELVNALQSVGEVVPLERSELNLLNPSSVRQALQNVRPDVVVNAAAYTEVDRAEDDATTCFAINEGGAALLAEYCATNRAALVHYSTDYVFDGRSSTPYRETDVPSPINVYGRSKLAGEAAIVSSQAPHLIFRCSWIYSNRRKNFVRTILRLARERRTLSVVNDQTGSPTWARSIAMATARILGQFAGSGRPVADAVEPRSGIYHLSAAGETTWYDFARRVLKEDPSRTEHVCENVQPIDTKAYGARAPRPAFSVLDTSKAASAFGIRMDAWPVQLETMMRSGGSTESQWPAWERDSPAP